MLQAGGDQEVAPRRQVTDEELKDGRAFHALGVVGLQHRELIQVGKQRAGTGVIHAGAASKSRAGAPAYRTRNEKGLGGICCRPVRRGASPPKEAGGPNMGYP